MECRELGGMELRVSAICLGRMTWDSQNSERNAHEQMNDALDAGVNFIDTAELYPSPPMRETQRCTECTSPRLPCAKKTGLFASLARDYLSSKYQQGALPKGSRKQLYDRLQRYETPNAAPAIDAAGALVRRHDMDPAQMAFQIMFSRPFVTSRIIGACTIAQLKSDIAAKDLKLSEEILAAINAIQTIYTYPCP